MAEIKLFQDRLTLENIDPESPLGRELTIQWFARKKETFEEPDFQAAFSEGLD